MRRRKWPVPLYSGARPSSAEWAHVCGECGGRKLANVGLRNGRGPSRAAVSRRCFFCFVPRFATPLRWGYAKVMRKSGAFAMAIGCVVRPAGAKPTAVLGGTTTQPRLLPRLAERLGERSPSQASSADNVY
jgi:hypothetical protein